MADDASTWDLIHAERAALVETLDGLTPEQWASPSLCSGWTVKLAAAHVVAGAEQTPPRFARRLVASGFRFNTMIDRDACHVGALGEVAIVYRLVGADDDDEQACRRRSRPMLGEVVVHGADIRRPLGLPDGSSPAAVVACLELYKAANFPVGTKRRIAGLRMVATDVDWTHGEGPRYGAVETLLLVMTGRRGADDDLTGAGAGCSVPARVGRVGEGQPRRERLERQLGVGALLARAFCPARDLAADERHLHVELAVDDVARPPSAVGSTRICPDSLHRRALHLDRELAAARRRRIRPGLHVSTWTIVFVGFSTFRANPGRSKSTVRGRADHEAVALGPHSRISMSRSPAAS